MSRASTKTLADRHLVQLTLALVIGLAGMQPLAAAPPDAAALYKNPDCQCCDPYAAYMRRHGLEVTVTAVGVSMRSSVNMACPGSWRHAIP